MVGTFTAVVFHDADDSDGKNDDFKVAAVMMVTTMMMMLTMLIRIIMAR